MRIRFALALCLLLLPDYAWAVGRVFYDDFENAVVNTSLWNATPPWHLARTTQTAADGGPGPHAGAWMGVTNWASSGPDAEYTSFNRSGWSWTSEMFIRMWFRYDANVDLHVGSKAFRLSGDYPNASFYWGCQMERPPNQHLFWYWEKIGATDGPISYGDSWRGCGDQLWHKLEIYIKANTTGQANGILRIWEDGEIVEENTNVVSVTDGHYWNKVDFASNWSNYTKIGDNFVYWDDFEIYSDTGTGGSGLMSDASITQGADTVPPIVLTVIPPNAGTSVSVASTVQATFNEAMDAATMTTSTIELRTPGNTVVPATVTYNAVSRTATLTPTSALAINTTYTAKVIGGGSGVKDLAGNALASTYTWTFTTGSSTSLSLGYTTIGSQTDTSSPDHLSGNRIVVGATPINMTSVNVHVGAVDAAPNNAYQVAVYTDSGGAPGSLIAASLTCTLTANSWNSCPLVATLPASTVLWIQYNTNGTTTTSNCMHFDQPGSGTAVYKNGGYPYGTWPTVYGASTVNTNTVYSMYAVATPVDTDTTPPTVSSVTPPSGETQAAITSRVTVTFSEPMDATTITTSTIELRTPGDTVVPASVAYDPPTRVATLTPTSNLAAGATYTANVISGGSGVKDVSGNALASMYTWAFTTATPPTVQSTIPTNTATLVSPNAPVRVTFSEAMDATTLTTSTIELRTPGNTVVAAVITYDVPTHVATLTPNSALTVSTSYTGNVIGGSSGIKDDDGTPLVTTYTWTFTTANAPLQVGPTRTYLTPCAAIAAAVNGDFIEIDGADGSGNQIEYVDDFCTWSKTNLTIRGVGSKRPHIRKATAALAGNQGIWRPSHVDGTVTTLTVENVEMSGANSAATNGQPIWAAYTSIILRNVYFHHNQNGFLSFNEPRDGAARIYDMTIENSEFAYNGGVSMGDNTGGQQHNIYIGENRNFTMTGSWTHDSVNGQDLKCRANNAFIAYNRIGDTHSNNEVVTSLYNPSFVLTGRSNYEVDYSIGGTLYLIGNLIIQGESSPQKIMFVYHHEVPPHPNSAEEIYVTNNTFVDLSGSSSTIAIWTRLADPTVQVIKNNIFAGFGAGSKILATGTGAIAATDPIDNLKYTTVAAANFVDALNQNYHLGGSATAINVGVDAGTAHSLSLNPVSHYTHPMTVTPRTTIATRDVGAYETNATLGALIPPPIAWTSSSAAAVTVCWTPSLADTDITQYRVRRGGSALATVTTALCYADTTAVLGTTYTYDVFADTASGSSLISNAVTGTLERQSAGTLGTALGWTNLLNTSMNGVITPTLNSTALFDRTAMTYDSQGNRILIWGNGLTRITTNHDNGVYAFDLDTLLPSKLNATDANSGTADAITAGGRPSARASFRQTAWMSNVNKMYVFGGIAQPPPGANYLNSTWLWTPGTDTWELKTPTGTIPSAVPMDNLNSAVTVYDAGLGKVWLLTQACLDRYDPIADAYERPFPCFLLPTGPTAVLDPVDHRLYAVSNYSIGYFNLTVGGYTPLTASSGCAPLQGWPGLAWDEVQNKIIGWKGGDVVYTLNPATNTCTQQTINGGPGHPTVAQAYTVNKRFQYIPPPANLFIALTDTTRNAYALRLTASVTPPPPSNSVPGRAGGGAQTGGGSVR